ncbi:MAG TPA: DUF983 domain-containing protein [Alphaproteobacteria bacterium]
MAGTAYPPVSPLRAGLLCCCPRCGEGRVFRGFLAVVDRCAVCGLEISRHDAGDGPAVFVILILGFLVVGLAILVEATLEPPLWVHMAVWPPFILVVAMGMLRPLKALLLALQYRHRPETIDGPD